MSDDSYYCNGTSLRTLLDSTNARAIFTRSGMMNGITHQPSTVPSPTAPVVLVYTTMNQMVPIA